MEENESNVSTSPTEREGEFLINYVIINSKF